ncbi:hypothetical protein AB7142_24545 [Escherichia coli]|uniref:hypothetical protein n=1 Tax=Enterobacterales TaxID=91347 RepID=UPI002DB87F62|nr:hypothetical protein [Escherichia coli]MEC4156441.1 hypothetical protein [Escherichia coli]
MTTQKNKIKKQCKDWYLSKSDGDFFSNPEAFPPLYTRLYEDIINNKKPSFYIDNDIINNIDDIKKCNTTFDRYLCSLYPSRFEASNPFEISEENQNEACLFEYLNSKYGGSFHDPDSFNMDRELKKIFYFMDDDDVKRLKKDARSSIYKILVLSYKLSIANKKWRDLIKYRTQEEIKIASMDNIVDFNESPYENARENSAIVKTFYYEIDQGKDDGDETHSKRIIQIPFYISVLNFIINLSISSCKDINSMEITSNHLVSIFSRIVGDKNKKRIKYENKNQEFRDLIQTSVLLNIKSNEVLSRNNLLSSKDIKIPKIKNIDNWVEKKLSNEDILKYINKDLNINFKNEWFQLSEILLNMFESSFDYNIINKHKLRNICCIITSHIFTSDNVNITSNIYGSRRNTYNVCYELKKFNSWLLKNKTKAKKENIQSWIRPITIYFFKYNIDNLVWQLEGSGKPNDVEYNEISKISNITLYKMISLIRKKNHLVCLDSIEYFISSVTENKIYNIAQMYLDSWSDPMMYYKLLQRQSIDWSPIN